MPARHTGQKARPQQQAPHLPHFLPDHLSAPQHLLHFPLYPHALLPLDLNSNILIYIMGANYAVIVITFLRVW